MSTLYCSFFAVTNYETRYTVLHYLVCLHTVLYFKSYQTYLYSPSVDVVLFIYFLSGRPTKILNFLAMSVLYTQNIHVYVEVWFLYYLCTVIVSKHVLIGVFEAAVVFSYGSVVYIYYFGTHATVNCHFVHSYFFHVFVVTDDMDFFRNENT